MRAILLVGGVSAAVLGAVVLGLWAMGSSAAERKPFSTLELAPQDVDLYVAVNTAPSSPQWIGFADVLDTIKVQDPLRDAWTDLLSEQDIDWDEDVVSLLGDEAYVAITDFDTLEDGHGLVAVAQLRDGERARRLFLRVAKQGLDDEDEGRELLEEEYEGETIYYVEGSGFFDDLGFSDEGFDDSGDDGGFSPSDEKVQDEGAIAFVGKHAVMGLSREDVQGVIDVIQGRAPTIATNPRFMELRAQQQEDFLLWGYIDLAPAWDELEEMIDESAQEGDAEPFDATEILRDARDNADRATFSISSRADGFVVDATVLRLPGVPAGSSNIFAMDRVFESRYAEQVPEDTLLFAAGYDLYNQVYKPAVDLLDDIDTNFGDSYCGSSFTSFAPIPLNPFSGSGGYDESNDPVLGRFYDDEGNFDFDAYEAYQAELEKRFTLPDGSIDYDAYYEFQQQEYERACEEASQTFDEAIEEFEQKAGFDLEDDLLALMTGEFALAVNATNFGGDEPEFDVLGLVDVAEPARAMRSMEQLTSYLMREEGFSVDDASGDSVHRLRDDEDSDDVFAWALRDGSLALSYPDAPAENFVSGLQGKSLAENENWKRTMDLLPAARSSVLYVSLSRLLEELRDVEDLEDDLADATDGEVTLDDLRPIRSLGMATSPIEGGVAARIVVFVD